MEKARFISLRKNMRTKIHEHFFENPQFGWGSDSLNQIIILLTAIISWPHQPYEKLEEKQFFNFTVFILESSSELWIRWCIFQAGVNHNNELCLFLQFSKWLHSCVVHYNCGIYCTHCAFAMQMSCHQRPFLKIDNLDATQSRPNNDKKMPQYTV